MDDLRQAAGPGDLTSDGTIALARAAAEAIRGLNWAAAGLDQPSAAYDVLGALSLAASRTGQALTQITRYLDRALAGGQLGHDHGENPAHPAAAAAVFPGDARLSAAALAGDLDAARQQLALVSSRPAHRTRKDQP